MERRDVITQFKKAAVCIHPCFTQLANLGLLILLLTPYQYRTVINLGKGKGGRALVLWWLYNGAWSCFVFAWAPSFEPGINVSCNSQLLIRFLTTDRKGQICPEIMRSGCLK